MSFTYATFTRVVSVSPVLTCSRLSAWKLCNVKIYRRFPTGELYLTTSIPKLTISRKIWETKTTYLLNPCEVMVSCAKLDDYPSRHRHSNSILFVTGILVNVPVITGILGQGWSVTCKVWRVFQSSRIFLVQIMVSCVKFDEYPSRHKYFDEYSNRHRYSWPRL